MQPDPSPGLIMHLVQVGEPASEELAQEDGEGALEDKEFCHPGGAMDTSQPHMPGSQFHIRGTLASTKPTATAEAKTRAKTKAKP